MLNGDAHHSLVWEVEPRIWPLLVVKDGLILNGKAQIVNRKVWAKPQKCTSQSGFARKV